MRAYAIFNPHNKPVDQLPVIYGFNNGGPGDKVGCIVAEDGEPLGGHVCSSEGFMYRDLGILKGSAPHRHSVFRQHYPDGYRMDFVGEANVQTHSGLLAAIKRHHERFPEQAEPDAPPPPDQN